MCNIKFNQQNLDDMIFQTRVMRCMEEKARALSRTRSCLHTSHHTRLKCHIIQVLLIKLYVILFFCFRILGPMCILTSLACKKVRYCLWLENVDVT